MYLGGDDTSYDGRKEVVGLWLYGSGWEGRYM